MKQPVPNKYTKEEIATLKIFSAYASKTGDKMGSKGYNARLSNLTSNIRSEMAKTKKPVASVVAPAKTVVAAKPSLRDIKASKDAAQKVKNDARKAEIARRNAAQKAKSNSDGTKKK